MESVLEEINAVVGVIGSFVCLPDGSIAARAVPEKYDRAHLDLAARIVSQTFLALETSGLRVAETDLVYGGERLILKNLRGGILAILCARKINVPLLNLTASVAAKKLVAAIRAGQPAPFASAAAPAPVPDQPAVPTQSPVLSPAPSFAADTSSHIAELELPPLVSELQEEAEKIIRAASSAQIILCVMDPVALWRRCRERRRLLAVPRQRQIDFAGRAEQSANITALFERLGYQTNPRSNATANDQCLNFAEPAKRINVEIFLDTFQMYHDLDLRPFLRPSEEVLPVTALVLVRLQQVEMPEGAWGELAALFIEYDASLVPDEGQIDASHISTICADDWDRYRTASTNLQQLALYAKDDLPLAERNVVIERARRLKSSLDAAPKSLRWQTRARLAESLKWSRD